MRTPSIFCACLLLSVLMIMWSGTLGMLNNPGITTEFNAGNHNGKIYYVHKNPYTDVETARGTCANEGAMLAEVNNEAEFVFMANYLRLVLPVGDDSYMVYIGGTDQAHENEWVFHSNGQPLPYTRWIDRLEVRKTDVNARCIAIIHNWFMGWNMLPDYCNLYTSLQSEKRRFMCEEI